MEEMKQNYLDRLNNLHQFLYCELPLKLMNHNEDETCIDLQNRLYTLIETGYIKETEQQLQQLIEENYKLYNKENDKQLINGLSTSEARYVKQIAELQHQRDELQDELDEKNFLLNQIQSKMERFEILSDNLIKAEQAIKELSDENIEISQQLQYVQEINQQYKNQIEELQQVVINKETTQNRNISTSQIYQLNEQVGSLRIELSGLQAELKIRMQILEQFKTQLTSDLVKGFHQILSKTKQEQQAETIEVKKQHQQLNEVTTQQINKLRKDVQFYKVLEEEYENKIKEVLNQKSDLESKVKLKDDQLQDIACKLDLIQQNIEQTELNFQNQLIQVINQREKYKIQLKNSKQGLQALSEKVQSLLSFNQLQTKLIEDKILQLESKIREENKELIDGLSQELSQSIETIKKQHSSIRQLELQCLKSNIQKTDQIYRQSEINNNRQSEINNRQSEINNRQSEIYNRQSDFESVKKQDNSFIGEKSVFERSNRLDEQRKYLDDLKKLHRTTKSQLKVNRKY
ncbi:unnamed protein product [Paramecium sonneborni]|uniref:Uncharacterized protein n=1 Tax=Paramecium sonneborni TaxID=65129 RepID=A0A8S1NXF5_9CILI|nr:unnamed protein product [Paramecium sonneborni]